MRANELPLELLSFESMASGARSLRLTRAVSWEAFPSYAEALARVLDGEILDRADSAAERVWSLAVDGGLFWLACDDFQLGISLEPREDRAAARIQGIRDELLRMRPPHSGDGSPGSPA